VERTIFVEIVQIKGACLSLPGDGNCYEPVLRIAVSA
jgi:hypothetical protein